MGKFLSSEGFRTRLMVAILMVAVLVPAYFLFDGIILKAILAFGFTMALIELGNVAICSRFMPFGTDLSLTSLLLLSLILALLSVPDIDISLLGTAIVACVSTDIGAYMFGNLIGGRIIRSRPFPRISPKKTWEGSFLGLLTGFAAVYLWTSGQFMYFWMVPVSFVGDILESLFKRRFGVKDSNDFIVQSNTPVLKQLEGLLGGRNGHGGFYDRLDSLSLVLAIQLLLSLAL